MADGVALDSIIDSYSVFTYPYGVFARLKIYFRRANCTKKSAWDNTLCAVILFQRD